MTESDPMRAITSARFRTAASTWLIFASSVCCCGFPV